MGITTDVSVTHEWTTLINAASAEGTASWKPPFELMIAVVEADDDVPTVTGHRFIADQQVSRGVSGFSEGSIKGRVKEVGTTVIVAVTQG